MFSKIRFYLRPLLGFIFTTAGSVLENAARDAVAEVEGDYATASDDEKRSIAFEIVKRRLIASGKNDIRTQLILTAIELAVLEYKRRKAAV